MDIFTTVLPYVAEIAAYLVITVLGVLGALASTKIKQKQELANIGTAIDQVTEAAQRTVHELQQKVVNDLKFTQDGKLTDEQIQKLKIALQNTVKQQLAQPTLDLLESVKVDVTKLIESAGEAAIDKIKEANTIVMEGLPIG
ncbi:hypothetical protein LJC27_01755 [Christensenellaceae bacterium OttesenSCG-928-M15]|nr:hypothetical protein [Christensenellaceae bacterium OttesenSCG-928-M15]